MRIFMKPWSFVYCTGGDVILSAKTTYLPNSAYVLCIRKTSKLQISKFFPMARQSKHAYCTRGQKLEDRP